MSTTPSVPHKTMIGGVAHEITAGYCKVGGVTYPIDHGLTKIDGVVYTIPFAPSAETIDTYPSATGTLTYTGSAQSPNWSDYDADKMDIGGTTSATNAGTYTTTFTPKDGYVWQDGTDAAYSVSWTIGKAAGKVTLSQTSVTLGTNSSTTVTISRLGDGALSATGTISVTQVAYRISGTTLTITSAASTDVTQVITVTAAESANYTAASATCTVAVPVSYTITITGQSGYGANAEITINGTVYTPSKTTRTLTAAKGTQLTCEVSGTSSEYATCALYIEVFGTAHVNKTVATNSSGSGAYTYTLDRDINITLESYSTAISYQNITVLSGRIVIKEA